MADQNQLKLIHASKQLNVGLAKLVEFLGSKGHVVESNPNTRLTPDQLNLLQRQFADSAEIKKEASGKTIGSAHGNIVIDAAQKSTRNVEDEEDELFIADRSLSSKTGSPKGAEEPQEQKSDDRSGASGKPKGLTILGKIDLEPKNRPGQKPQSSGQGGHSGQKPHQGGQHRDQRNDQRNDQRGQGGQGQHPNRDNRSGQGQNRPSDRPAGAHPRPEHRQDRPQHSGPKTVEPVQVRPTTPVEQHVPPVHPPVQPDHVPADRIEDEQLIEAKAEKLQGLRVLGKIELPSDKNRNGGNKPATASDNSKDKDKKKRKRKRMEGGVRPASEQVGPRPEGGGHREGGNREGGQHHGANREGGHHRPQGQGYQGNRPQGQGYQGNRPQGGGTGQHPGANREGGQHTGGNRPQGGGGGHYNRPQGQGYQGNRPQPILPGTTPAPAAVDPDAPLSAAASAAKKKDKRKGREEVSRKEVDEQYRRTMATLSGGKNAKLSSKRDYRKKKRLAADDARQRQMEQDERDASILRVTEFISASELASMMDVAVTELISKGLALGMFISINQRLDAQTIEFLADEFGYTVEFTSAEEEADAPAEEKDEEDSLVPRAPIVTIMGHVDHGKTSLLDYIRKSRVVEKEAGGITQHIGAYDVTTNSGRRIVFLDTPGHEAFTAMRARGAKVTDIVIIVIAADDNVMPQTVEAINHAQLAGVPIIIAINKIDRPEANPTKIKQELAGINVLVEEYGGKVPCQEISAKKGIGVDDLLELVLLQADILELKANPDKRAVGTIIEASLDKGKGYVSTVLVQSGTLNVGDVILAGPHYGRVKAMTDHTGKRLKTAGPSTPVQVMGLGGAPQAGDKLSSTENEREAREIAAKREQIQREQSIRATKRTTLVELGRRIALGNFKQLNLIIKGDVDGSVEALTDSLLKLSTEQVQVSVIYKAVGPISEADVALATASEAIIIGFQVRPTPNARKSAEQNHIEVRFYSIIYDAINDVRQAMEGLLGSDFEEVVVGNVEIRETFRISKVGTIAGCMVTEGYIKRNSRVRVIRDGIVVYGGEQGAELLSLKRFKDDASEVKQGFDCGISIRGFNDMQVGDVIEVFEQKEIKRKL